MPRGRAADLSAGDATPLGTRIRLRRQARRVLLSRMADDLGYDKGHLSKIENNRVMPTPELLNKIAQYLATSSSELVDAPLRKLTDAAGPEASFATVFVAQPALPVKPPRQRRAVGERVERLIRMARLSEEEEALLAERLAAVTRELIALIKEARRLGD